MTALDQAEAALLDALAAVRAARGASVTTATDLLEVDEAARLAGRTESTVRKWARDHRLGRRLGGRWLLSRARFVAFIAGETA